MDIHVVTPTLIDEHNLKKLSDRQEITASPERVRDRSTMQSILWLYSSFEV